MTFKTVAITSYKDDGSMSVQMKLGLKRAIAASDYHEAKEQLARILEPHFPKEGNYTVEWKRDGYNEGYLVTQSPKAGEK